ncbi:glycosyltransferase family 2 protein [Emcibacteraceae bacterium]|nr:glycosyltransferase family 2 protein [Emcibacteraceae bacterium]
MVKKNKLSLIITNFNGEPFIPRLSVWFKEAIDYLENVIIVDDCSTDGSVELINKLMPTSQFLLLKTDVNSGRPSIPRNIGLKHISGDRVLFMDIDDLVPVEYIKFLQSFENKNITSGTKYRTDSLSNVSFNKIDFTKIKIISSGLQKYKNYVCLSGASLPIDLAKSEEFANEPLEDWAYFYNIMSKDKNINIVKFVQCPIVYYSKVTLSPNKYKQLIRLYKKLGLFGLLVNLVLYLKLRFIEKGLEFNIEK